MPALNPAPTEPVTATFTPPAHLKESAVGCLRRSPYSALQHVSCDCREGVLVLQGCLPSFYLKQVAQESVARLEGVARIDNQIQVVTPASESGPG